MLILDFAAVVPACAQVTRHSNLLPSLPAAVPRSACPQVLLSLLTRLLALLLRNSNEATRAGRLRLV